ncbi:response regulator [Clostridium sp. AM58-1XD]|uniref:response regulator n=1 Tax=Clostridium sp. AM58-1XD TaxID=2292307 RepID=UPI000E528F81|nr:response regulator [Clostridium sp. AM58-1XD]RGY96831.1 response regulator [Clostridium sp. AM58-1XD]
MGYLIMVADDALFMRNIIKKALAEGGYNRIVEAANGLEVVECYREHRPDLVFLDITMPGRGGLDILVDLLAEDENAKIIMCSAMGQESVILQAVQKGALDFITKPFRAADLIKMVETYLKQ